MSLAPSLSLTLGSLRYDTQSASAHICLATLPRGSSAEIVLPASVRFEAVPGDKAECSVDGGEGAQKVLTGKVRYLRRGFDQIAVTIADCGAELSAYRPSATLEAQDAGAIVNKLASDVSAATGTVDIDLDLAAYAAHPTRTAAEHIASLAFLSGGLAYTDGDGSLNVRKRPSGPADSALKYGREIIRCDVRDAAPVNPQRFAMGFGPAGSGGAPDALRQTVDALPGEVADGRVGVRRVPVLALRIPSAAASASGSMQAVAAAQTKQLTASCFLLAGLRPGNVIEIQSTPDDLASGPWLVTRVEHKLQRGAGETRFWAETTAGSSLLNSLLGAALGAVGGLL